VGNRDYPVDVCCVGNGHQPGSCKIAGAAHFGDRRVSFFDWKRCCSTDGWLCAQPVRGFNHHLMIEAGWERRLEPAGRAGPGLAGFVMHAWLMGADSGVLGAGRESRGAPP
jgi:hypothetical protein